MGVAADGKRLAELLASIPASVKVAANAALDQGANEMVVRAKLLAPVDDGTLQMSIKKEDGPRELSVSVVAGGEATTRPVRNSEKGNAPEFDYSLAIEYGTEEAPAQPFFWPAVNSTKKRVRRRVDRAISKAIKAAWGYDEH